MIDAARRCDGASAGLDRFIATPRITKHRLFVWLRRTTLARSAQLIVFARDDDYFFGVLHSSVHELWARAAWDTTREVESGFRYTPTTTFETFPFPRRRGRGEGRDSGGCQSA